MSSLETDCKLAEIQQKEEAQNNQRMGERTKVLEKDLTLQQAVGDMKEIVWVNIIDSVNDVCPSIQVIFEQTELVKVVMEAIHKTMEELEDKPEEANQLITFFNKRNM